MLKFAICDDEPLMSEELSSFLTHYMDARARMDCQISAFADGPSLLSSGCAYDLIFLDIQMGPPDGMEIARQLRRMGSRSLLVFVTVLEECVFDAFDVEAFGYLVKPLDPGRFQRTMDRAMAALERASEQCLLIQRGTSCEKIPLDEILYCEVLGRKIYIHRAGGSVTDYYGRLEELEKRMDRRFFRCHRSYLVNLDHVRGCRGGQVILSREGSIPVSRLREREFTQALLRQMQERSS